MNWKSPVGSVIEKLLFLAGDFIPVALTASLPWFVFAEARLSNAHFFVYIFGSPILYIANLLLHLKRRPFGKGTGAWRVLSWIGRILSTLCLIPILYFLVYFITHSI